MQVFISSTYTDLIEERQHAVQAVLDANHIPAGMELFKAGDEDQLTVIKKWIDDSDIYMLILGGRYGSLEPKTKLSYTHLEFDYALKSGKPIFALVLSDNMLKHKTLPSSNISLNDKDVYEQKNKKKYIEFKSLVAGPNRTVKFPDNVDQLKMYTLTSLYDMIRSKNLSGWVKATDSELIAENTTLRKKITELTDEINSLKTVNTNSFSRVDAGLAPAPTIDNIGGFTINEIVDAMKNVHIEMYSLPYDIKVNTGIMDTHVTALELFVNPFVTKAFSGVLELSSYKNDDLIELVVSDVVPLLLRFNLVHEYVSTNGYTPTGYALNPNGHFFLGKLID